MADTSYDYSPYFYQSGLNTSVDNRQSYPESVNSPQTDWGLQLSQMLASLGQNQYNWARDEYNKGMKITDQRINDFMKLSGYGQGLAKNLMGRYTDVFQPIMDKYIQQAGTYNSEARQRFNMGRAESTVGQADQAAMDSAQRQLQSFGINPNSGRYQDLILSGRIKDAAARAGAGTKASMDTAQIGRDMTLQAAKMGQNVPGMTVNALNSAYQGVQGAQNALTSMMNTGANLANSASNMLGQSGNANKVPPTGQVTNRPAGTGSGGGFNTKPGSEGQGKGGGGGGGAGKGGKGMWDEPPGKSDPLANRQGSGGKMLSGGGKGGGKKPKEEDDGSGQPDYFDPSLAEQLGLVGPNSVLGDNPNTAFGDPNAGDMVPPGWENRTQDPNENPLTGQEFPPTTGFRDPNSAIDPRNSNGGTGEEITSDNAPGEGQEPYDASQFAGWFDQQNESTGSLPEERLMDNEDLGGGGEKQGPQQDFGNYGGPDFNGTQQNFGEFGADQGNYGSGDYGGGGYGDYGGGYGGQYAGDTGGDYGGGGNGNYGGGDYGGGYQGGNNFGDYNFGGYYAKGGRVRPRMRNGTTGGPVPKGASPSRGRVTDDVPARLNADEFVIPRDVKLHKGTEFFQKLITASRKARGVSGPPPKPTMKPALRLKPTFVSRPM